MAEERSTQIFTGTLKDILEGISPDYNVKLRESFFDAVNELDDDNYNPTDLGQTIKIIGLI